jgi:8-oxo-dGTP diphosphatase
MLLADAEFRTVISDLVTAVPALDRQEAEDQAEILRWVRSGAQLSRVERPATPPKHLVVYCALLDEADSSLLLVDHVKAKCWLLPGGHVDEGEDPRRTAERETFEELAIMPEFYERYSGDKPFFLTITQTRSPQSHTDVTLWFVLRGDQHAEMRPDPREFTAMQWLRLDDHVDWSGARFDPQMHRFVAKLTAARDRRDAGLTERSSRVVTEGSLEVRESWYRGKP